MKSQIPLDNLLSTSKTQTSNGQEKLQIGQILLGLSFVVLLAVTFAPQQKKSLLEQIAIPLAALGVAGGLALNTSKSLNKPLNRLQRLSQELARGNYQVRSQLLAQGEIGQLTEQLDSLAENLENRQSKTQQITELFRRLVDLSCSPENEAQLIKPRLQKVLTLAKNIIGAEEIYVYQGEEREILAEASTIEQMITGSLKESNTQVIPLTNGGLVIVGTNNWTQAEKSLIEQLASQLGQIISQLNERQQQQSESKLVLALKNLTLKIASSLEQQKLFDLVVKESRAALESDRVIVYQFNANWQGTVVAESLEPGYPKALNAMIHDPCFAANYVEKYKRGRIQATPDILNSGLTECHLGQLKPFSVRANLVAPILSEGNLYGLLITHQCSGPRNWQKAEMDYFIQLASQLGVALERAQLNRQQQEAEQQQRKAKEILQKKAQALLKAIQPASMGNLTVQAEIGEDEVGTIARSYNQTLGNIRQILSQVKATTTQLTQTSQDNKQQINQLAQASKGQYQELQTAVEQVQYMEQSIERVQQSAQEALKNVQEAHLTVSTGESNMNQTVEGIQAIRETVIETSKKVETLGEASEKISKVVNLISHFAAQTHILALKASIEAARAGEEGESFAVIADEVRSLAAQSAEASSEIETLVGNIQIQTIEVIRAMETGTQQVTLGTRLAETTRLNLQKIALASNQITHLVENISQASQEQTQTSSSMTQVIHKVASVAQKTASSATEVTEQVDYLISVVGNLQLDLNQFKL